ncbi:hypothetical protein Adt_41927 [Abeliophyllum distichum]|uniref:Uncharacterized protein n=1 Tax=Abeliophyllum distichum TaxID=126358 RepID=A0ABD1PU70_9LAMI
MAVASPVERCKEDSFTSSPIGSSIQLKFLVTDGIKSQLSDNHVCPYKYPNCTSDQRRIVDAVEEVGSSSLSEKFSNGTSTMDINDRRFDDLDFDDKVDNHLPKVSMVLVRLLLSLVMIFRK